MPWLNRPATFVRAFLTVSLFAQIEHPALAHESTETLESSSSDITRPAQRLDLKIEHESAPEERANSVTVRYDHPFSLSRDWSLNLRIDVPFTSITHRGEHASSHEDASGPSDVLLHAVFAYNMHEEQGLGFGSELIIPTAGEEALGKGKWRVRPLAAYRWSLSGLGNESFVQLLLRYDVSFAGDSSRSDISEIQFAPNLEIGISRTAFVSFFPNPDIQYDFISDELFVPINMEVGKNVGNVVLSLEVGKAIVYGDHPPYDWKAGGRVGIRF